MEQSFKKLFFVLAFIFGLFAVMVFAKSVLIPLSMALLISFILFPCVKKLESLRVNKVFSALFTLLMLIVLIGGGITIFATELISLSGKLTDFTGKIMEALSDAVMYVNDNLYFTEDFNREEVI